MSRSFFIAFLTSLFVVGVVRAQIEMCPLDIEVIFDQIIDDCKSLGRNQVCYANHRIDTETLTNSAAFGDNGDIIAVSQLLSLRTYPLSETLDEWGIALFRIQANIPDTLPGQNVTLVAFGDTEILPDIEDKQEPFGTMQAFYFTTGIGIPTCKDIPEGGILLQSPQSSEINLTINGFDLIVGSTVLFTAENTDALTIATIEGNVDVNVDGAIQSIPAGQSLHVIRDNTGVTSATQITPVLPAAAALQRIPIGLLSDYIPISAADGWVATGLQVKAGQQVTIAMAGVAASCAHDECPEPYDRWVSPAGLTDTICPDCLMTGVPEMVVIGRIGDGSPFLVGEGAEMIADSDGILFLAANDADYAYDDNAGTFYALITIADP